MNRQDVIEAMAKAICINMGEDCCQDEKSKSSCTRLNCRMILLAEAALDAFLSGLEESDWMNKDAKEYQKILEMRKR